MMTSMTTVAVNQEGTFMNVNISQVGNRLYVNGYEYRNGRWKRTLRAIIHALF